MQEKSDISKVSTLKTYLFFFSKKLRLSNPWNFKVPVLISFTYLVLLLSNYSQLNIFFAFFCSLLVIIGVAGIGYTSNDWGDRKKDKAANKPNILVQISLFKIIALFVLFFALVIFPWFYLPFNRVSFVFLCAEIVLFFMYAFPPFRFKELGFIGVLTDTLYAHVLPAMLATHTFFLFTKQSITPFQVTIIGLIIWQLLLGLRNILFHQLKDQANDLASKTKTFVTSMGEGRSQKITLILISLEVIAFSFFLCTLFLKTQIYLLPIVAIVYWMLMAFNFKVRDFDFRAFAYKFLDDFYINWLPLALLLQLCSISYIYLLLILLHITLFKNDLKSKGFQFLKQLFSIG